MQYNALTPTEYLQVLEEDWRKEKLLQIRDIILEKAYDFKEHMQAQEIALLQSALEHCRFNQKKTAEFLGMTYHQLRGYLRKYELTDSTGD